MLFTDFQGLIQLLEQLSFTVICPCLSKCLCCHHLLLLQLAIWVTYFSWWQALSIVSVSLLAVEKSSDFSPIFFIGMMEVMLNFILFYFPPLWILFSLPMWLFSSEIVLCKLYFYSFFSGHCCCSYDEYLYCRAKSVVWHRDRQGSK